MRAGRFDRFSTLKKLRVYRPEWDWRGLQGSDACLHWNAKDLETLEQALKYAHAFDVAVQAGSNLGLFPKRLAEQFKTVYTFEPDEKLFSQAKHNAPEQNIVFYRAALGNSVEPISLGYGRRDGSGKPNHEGLTHVAGAGTISQVRIDDMELHALDFMYLDIEGYELFALKGAEQTIARYRPVIVVEINSALTHYGLEADQLRGWLSARNYVKQFRIHSDELYVPLERQR